jgi:hypothetical protein
MWNYIKADVSVFDTVAFSTGLEHRAHVQIEEKRVQKFN